MHYEHKELGFSFNLPEGWQYDEGNIAALTFYGPNGGIGCTTELIQIQIGTIKPQYFDPDRREKFLAKPGAKVLRSKVGDETNVVVMRKANDSEISVVRDGIHYVICHFNDAATEKAIERLKQSVIFPSREKAATAIQSWADPRSQAVSRMLHGKAPVPAPQTPMPARKQKHRGFLGRFLALFQSEPAIQTCETCSHQMQVLDFSDRGSVMLSTEEFASGIGHAEQCWECGRLYCAECYPSRPLNTCVCGRGRDAVRIVEGTVYRGSLRLVKVRYISSGDMTPTPSNDQMQRTQQTASAELYRYRLC